MWANIFVAFLTYILGIELAVANDRDVVANIFHVDVKYLVMNLPPRPDTYPGAIFTSDLRFPIVYGNVADSALHHGPPIGIDSSDGFTLSGGAGVELPSLFGVSATAANDADIILSFPDARIIDMTLHDLVKHIEQSPDAMDSVKAGQKPIIIVRSYSGTPTVTITRKVGASASAWDRIKALVTLKATASTETDNTIAFRGKDEIVFAFETSEIHFGSGGSTSNDIQIAAVPEQLIRSREASIQGKEFSVCIGDICNGSANANFSCGFAYAHPSDTDDAAARTVCTVQNSYSGYRYTRTLTVGGGRCGEIVLSARCSD
jgi:hypothetical protein